MHTLIHGLIQHHFDIEITENEVRQNGCTSNLTSIHETQNKKLETFKVYVELPKWPDS